MVLFGGLLSIKAVAFLVFSVFIIAALGYLLGRITINGISLGTAGVFIVALLFGAFFYFPLFSFTIPNRQPRAVRTRFLCITAKFCLISYPPGRSSTPFVCLLVLQANPLSCPPTQALQTSR